MVFVGSQSYRASDLAATKENDNCREVAEVAAKFFTQRSQQGRSNVVIVRRIKSVVASILCMHKRPVATDCDRQLVAKAF